MTSKSIFLSKSPSQTKTVCCRLNVLPVRSKRQQHASFSNATTSRLIGSIISTSSSSSHHAPSSSQQPCCFTANGHHPHSKNKSFSTYTQVPSEISHEETNVNVNDTKLDIQQQTLNTETHNSNQTQSQEAQELHHKIQQFCHARQPYQADRLLRQALQQQNAAQFTTQDWQECCNGVLWGYTKTSTNDRSAIPQAEQLLETMLQHQIPPNTRTYHYLLKCWSRTPAVSNFNSRNHNNNSQTASHKAEWYLRQLQQLGVADMMDAYHLALKACAKVGDHDRALRLLHEFLQQSQQPLQQYSNVQSSNNNEDANAQFLMRRRVTKEMAVTVLMAMKSSPEQAEQLLEQWQFRGNNNILGFRLDTVHYATVLDAWARVQNGPRAEALFGAMISHGIPVNVIAINSLLQAWRGNLDRLEELFQALVWDYVHHCHDHHSFNNNTDSGQQQQNQQEEQQQYQQQRWLQQPVAPDVHTLSIVLSAQAQANAPDRAENMLQWILHDPRIANLLKPNLVCFTNVLNAWVRVKQPQRAETLLRQLQALGMTPNVVAYTTVLHGWAMVGDTEKANAIWHEIMSQKNLQPNLYSLNTYLLAYVNARQPERAQKLLERILQDHPSLFEPDVMTYATLLRGYMRSHQPQKARQLLDELRRKERASQRELLDLVSYNSVLTAYSNCGMPKEAELLLQEMLQDDRHTQQANNHKGRKLPQILPDAQSFSLVMTAYTKSKQVEHRQKAGARAEELFELMTSMDIQPNAIAYNVLMNCFANSGLPDRAEAILWHVLQNDPKCVDVVSLNTCLNAWARVGNALRAEQLLMEMVSTATTTADPSREESQSLRKKTSLNKRHEQTTQSQQPQTSFAAQPDVQSFSIVLSAWAKQETMEAAKHAEAILEHMTSMGGRVQPDSVAYNSCLHAYSKVAQKHSSDSTIVNECILASESLLQELEDLCKQRLKDARFRPDRLSYGSMVQLWKLKGDHTKVEKYKGKVLTCPPRARRR